MDATTLKKTALYGQHLKLGARMFSFGEWHMPINYGSDLAEHERVRHHVGIFDVSHMSIIDIEGTDVLRFLRFLCCTDISRYEIGQCVYTCLLNHDGGIIDDLLMYKRSFFSVRLVVNANCAEKDFNWIKQQSDPFSISITRPTDLNILAIQGPKAAEFISQLFPQQAEKIFGLPSFSLYEDECLFISRTGYTGEDGFECIMTKERAIMCWEQAISLGITPCGLGARNILRLEAAMNLYGHEMDSTVRPQECGCQWIIDLRDPQRDFIGKAGAQEPARFKRLGVVTKERGMLRDGMTVHIGDTEGLITSGTYSPILNKGIGLCRVPLHISIDEDAYAISRGKEINLSIVKPPFISSKRKI